MKKKRTKAGTSKAAAAARRMRFVEAYLANGQNASRAAIEAGFSEKGSRVTGTRLIADPNVRALIEKRRAELLDRYELTTEGVLRELARITYFDAGKCFDAEGKPLAIGSIPEDTRRALAAVKDGEVKAFDKNSAVKTAMQYLNLLPRHGVAVQTNVSVAAAEVAAIEPESRSLLEIGRRIAFTLALAAQESPAR